MAEKKIPEVREFVICRVKEVQPHSALVDLVEYDQTGMIHISEIASTWVRDIRKFVKENEILVCQVLPLRGMSNYLDLSLKRVSDRARKERIEEWQQQKKAEKFISKLAHVLNESENEICRYIIDPLKKKYETAFKGFEHTLIDPEEVRNLLSKKYFDAVHEIAKENIRIKEYVLENFLILTFSQGDGLKHIQEALDVLDFAKGEDVCIQVEYLSAPRYRICVSGRNIKSCKDTMNHIIEHVTKYSDQHRGVLTLDKA